ncbi:MAG: GNAT family N-acetyltransferase [Ottowia sp.]|nr:GNAT family N-acetyltransferase [Ottowia sp.]
MTDRLEIQIVHDAGQLDRYQWDALLAVQDRPTPFMRHAYLQALQASGSATQASGWAPRHFALWQGDALVAACPLLLKTHSWGEYVFDFAWARAYAEHGLAYYPKAVIAVPFTPVPGSRLLARDAAVRRRLLQAVLRWCEQQELSSLHLLFGSEADQAAATECGLMPRAQVQFHWHNAHPATGRPFADFDEFLGTLKRDKRKKIRQERRRVADAGVRFRWARGPDITSEDWAFFYRCYQRTYLEHGNAPYLNPDFFARMAAEMAGHWVLFVAERSGRPIACSLIAVGSAQPVAWGRYWGALERVSCLHFEACYYQPIAWCIAHGIQRFEGGAQGEHKLARALLPAQTHSMHWLAHPAFADAVDRYLQQERSAEARYVSVLQQHTPFRDPQAAK